MGLCQPTSEIDVRYRPRRLPKRKSSRVPSARKTPATRPGCPLNETAVRGEQTVEHVWLAGVHSDVRGWYDERGLSNAIQHWREDARMWPARVPGKPGRVSAESGYLAVRAFRHRDRQPVDPYLQDRLSLSRLQDAPTTFPPGPERGLLASPWRWRVVEMEHRRHDVVRRNWG